jgi:predicted neuraminidase
MQRRSITICFIFLVLVVLGLGLTSHTDLASSKLQVIGFSAASVAIDHRLEAREISRQDIPMPADTPAAHASFLLADKDGNLRIFWFAGSRESGADVQIVMASRPHGSDVWSQPAVVVNRHAASKALGFGGWIRRLGNPVAWIDAQGRTHLYVVATGLGGWAASRVLHLVQTKQDEPFKPIGFLQLSPLFNLSTLVRGVPVPMQDGGVLLPAYFEIGIKYPLAIRLDANGDLVQSRDAVVRMAGNLKSLQPTVVVQSELKATAYLRDNSEQRKLRFVQTTDGGKSWQTTLSSQGGVDEAGADWVINPDSSPIALRVQGQTLLIHNPQTSGRHRLVIEASSSGLRGFKRLATLEYEPEKLEGVEFNEYSYPSAVQIGDQLHVSYTYQKALIRHVVLAIERKASDK